MSLEPVVHYSYRLNVGSGSAKRFAGTRVLLVQFVVFSALGWLLAGFLHGVRAMPLRDALFVAGLVVGVVAAFVFLQANGMTTTRHGFRQRLPSDQRPTDGLVWGVSVSRFEALAAVSGLIAAGGLVLAAALID